VWGTPKLAFGGVDVKGFGETGREHHTLWSGHGLDTDYEVEVAADQALEEAAGRGHREVQVDLGTVGVEGPDGLGPVLDRYGIDRSEPDHAG
jgi:hypothetical protein